MQEKKKEKNISERNYSYTLFFILYFRKILYIEISNRKETRHRASLDCFIF